jgi:magnesium transporter
MLESRLYRKNGSLQEDLTVAEVAEALSAGKDILWLDFQDPTEEELSVLIDVFKFHPLAIEDCLLPRHHPKVDDYGDYLFMIIHAPDLTAGATEVSTHELDIFLGRNYVVTFHDKPVKSVTAAALLAKEEPAKIMGHGADFLIYEILDALFQNYDILLDKLEGAIDSCQNEVANQCPDIMAPIGSVQHSAHSLYRVVRMQREFLRNVSRGTYKQISKKATPYFRDVYDHLVRINETLEVAMEAINGERETYLYNTSNKINEVIKILTVLTIVVMVPTLVAGVYGMNLYNFIGDKVRWGFPLLLGLIFLSIILTLFAFKKKGWY